MPGLNILDLYPRGDFGEQLGQVLGQLGGDVAQKIGQRNQAKQIAPLLQGLGLSPEQAQAFGYLQPQAQAQYLRNAQAAQTQARQQQMQQGEQNQLDSILQQMQASPTEQYQPQQEVEQIDETIQEQAAPEQERPRLQTVESGLQNKINDIDRVLQRTDLTPTNRLKIEERRNKLNEGLEKRIEKNEKATEDYTKNLLKEYKSAQQTDKRLGRMRTLIEQGNLTYPIFGSLLDTLSKGIFGFGIDLSSITSSDTQEFKKLSTDFLKEAKNIFGSRLTDNDVRFFLQTVPTLSQSDEGKLRVINNLENFNKAIEVKKKTFDEIVEENNGIRPRNIERLVERRVKPILDELSSNFKSGDKNVQESLEKRNISQEKGVNRMSKDVSGFEPTINNPQQNLSQLSDISPTTKLMGQLLGQRS